MLQNKINHNWSLYTEYHLKRGSNSSDYLINRLLSVCIKANFQSPSRIQPSLMNTAFIPTSLSLSIQPLLQNLFLLRKKCSTPRTIEWPSHLIPTSSVDGISRASERVRYLKNCQEVRVSWIFEIPIAAFKSLQTIISPALSRPLLLRRGSSIPSVSRANERTEFPFAVPRASNELEPGKMKGKSFEITLLGLNGLPLTLPRAIRRPIKSTLGLLTR